MPRVRQRSSLRRVEVVRKSARAMVVVMAVGLLGGLVPTSGAVAAEPNCGALPKEHLGAEFVRPDVNAARADAPGVQHEWWAQDQWDAELEMLDGLCVGEVVMQWTAQTWVGPIPPEGVGIEPAPACVKPDARGRYVLPLYTSSTAVWDQNREARGESCTEGAGRGDQVKFALEAAKRTGMRVWLGLPMDERAFYFLGGSENAAWMAAQATLAKEVMEELWAAYGNTFGAQIAGFYLPFEGNNRWYSADPNDQAQQDYERYAALKGYTDTVSLHARALDDTLGVMVSPYLAANIGADPASAEERALRDRFENTVRAMLTGSGVTVYAPQDATGARYTTSTDVAPWLVAAQRGANAAKTGTALWLVVEQYSMQGIGSLPVMELVSHMRQATVVVPSYKEGANRADVSRFLGFSSNNLSPRSAYWSYSSLYRSAYRTYLSLPAGAAPKQTVPKVGSTTYPNNTTVTAALIAGTLDVTVQWPMITKAPTPDGADFPAVGIIGYQVFRDGQPVSQVLQPLTGDGAPAPPAGGVMAFTDPSVQTGRTYHYEVAAFDAFGNSSPRVGVEVTAPLTAADALVAGGADARGARLSDNSPYVVVNPGGNPGSLWDRVTAGDNGAYLDGVTTSKLVDGSTGEASYVDPGWVGLNTSAALQVEVTLPDGAVFDTVRSHWLNDTPRGITPPQAVTVSSRAEGRPDTTPVSPLPGGVDPGTGVGPGDSLPESDFSDPGTGWMTARLPAGQTHTARTVIIDVTPTSDTAWAFLSEIQVLTPTGKNLCADGACTAVTRTAGGIPHDGTYRNTEGRTLTSPDALRTGQKAPVTGDPSSNAARTVGWKDRAGIDLVIDLGENHPLGGISTDWWHMPSWGAAAPTGITLSYLADNGGDTAPDLTPTGSWKPAPSATTADTKTNTGATIRTYTSTVPTVTPPGGGATKEPVMARWVKLEITNTTPANWMLTTSVTLHAPAAWDLTTCRPGEACTPPRIYNTPDNTNDQFDPARPVDQTNWPTEITANLPPLATDGEPFPVEPCGVTGACRTQHASGAGVLIAKDGAGIPVGPTGTRYEDFIDKALVLAPETGEVGWDLVVPLDWRADTGQTWSRINSPAITLLHNPTTGTNLPATIDLLYAHDHDANITRDADRTWNWSGYTARAPKLPPFLPANTAFLHTYTFPPVTHTGGGTIELLRFHLNAPTTGDNLVAARVQAAAWK